MAVLPTKTPAPNATKRWYVLEETRMPDWMWWSLLAGAAAVNLLALPISVMEPDSAVYATIAKTMALENNYLELFRNGQDWLDKPHFQFWATALSFELFGINTVSFKLPALLFLFLGAFYTYRFARELYNVKVARLAALLLLTALHIIISNADVRAEPFLTGLIIASVYHFYRVKTAPSWKTVHLPVAAFYAGCAVMTKGIFVLIPIGFAIIGEIVLKREWRELFSLKWLLAVLLTFLFFTPELYALYYQFDMHPEKMVFGRTGVSGIRFFLWDSQWGRFTNTGPITGQGNFFTFFHVALWAFLPWSVALFAAVVRKIGRNLPKPDKKEEFYSLSGAAVTFLVFSLSDFQLPHYLNILFPFFSVITADFICRITTPAGKRLFSILQYAVIGIMLAAIVLVFFLSHPEKLPPLWWASLPLIGFFFFFIRKENAQALVPVVIWRTCLGSFAVYLFLVLVFYPDLMRYQAGALVAQDVNERFPTEQRTALYRWDTNAFEFYLNRSLKRFYYQWEIVNSVKQEDVLILTDERHYRILQRSRNLAAELIKTYDHYWVSRLTPEFINYRTRAETLEKKYLVRVQYTDDE